MQQAPSHQLLYPGHIPKHEYAKKREYEARIHKIGMAAFNYATTGGIGREATTCLIDLIAGRKEKKVQSVTFPLAIIELGVADSHLSY